MARRFHFDLKNGETIIRDRLGIEACDLAQAVKEAESVIKEMRDSGELSEDEEGWVLIIKDATGGTLMTLPVVPRVLTSAVPS